MEVHDFSFEDKAMIEDKAMFVPSPKAHFIVSLLKSVIRLFGALVVTILALFGAPAETLIFWLALTIFVAELVGVIEEIL
jgi:hypothetical protein